MTFRASAVVATVFLTVLLLVHPGSVQPAAAAPQIPKPSHLTLKASRNSIIGFYTVAGLGFDLRAGALLTLGMTYTEKLGLEPFVALSRTTAVAPGWNLTLLLSYGDVGGDYRVERLPEITLARSAPIAGTRLTYTFDAGLGYFVVKPNNLSGGRGTLGLHLGTGMPLSPWASFNASAGYRQYLYFDGGANSAVWGSAQLGVTPLPTVSTTFTYFYQDASGSSPLLFDNMGRDNYLSGALSIRLGPTVTVSHSQTHSYITQAISARVYTLTLSLERGQSFSISWDDVPQKLSFSFSRPLLGAFSLNWETTAQLLSFTYQR